MELDFALLRLLARKAANETSFDIVGDLPRLDFSDAYDGRPAIRIEIPEGEGTEFSHWRVLHEEGFVRISHEGRPGIGKLRNHVDGPTARCLEFVALAQDDETWEQAVEVCRTARALTIPNVLAELRTAARKRIRAVRLEDGRA
jgi:hypothetical protein